MRRFQRGFTLIEVMIVVAIIGVLAAIAIVQYQNFIARSQEASVKGNLGVIRSALSIYYSDLEGNFPVDAANLVSLTAGGKYLQLIPPILLPRTTNSPGHPLTGVVTSAAIDDSGGYYYYNGGLTQIQWGQIVVNCTHLDLRGTAWSAD